MRVWYESVVMVLEVVSSMSGGSQFSIVSVGGPLLRGSGTFLGFGTFLGSGMSSGLVSIGLWIGRYWI